VTDLRGKDRLIVALDVSSAADAVNLIDTLDNVSFFKVGWQLFMTGVTSGALKTVFERLARKHVFVDLKVPGDIDHTISAVVDVCVDLANVRFLTLSEAMPPKTIKAARAARVARNSDHPKLLTVPLVSSLDAGDLRSIAGEGVSMDQFLLSRARAALDAGCDGVIASGDAIRLCRANLPAETLIVSPGIRPAGASTDDHKRHTTPADAIRAGADYLVVGRPITRDPDPRSAAGRVIGEIDAALATSARA
jgi:orotidine-5'-phosphate decarboxylase